MKINNNNFIIKNNIQNELNIINNNKNIDIYNKYHNNNTEKGIYIYDKNMDYRREIIQKGEINYDYQKKVNMYKRFSSPIKKQYLNLYEDDNIDMDHMKKNINEKILNKLNDDYNTAVFNAISYELDNNMDENNINDIIMSLPNKIDIPKDNNNNNDINNVLDSINIYNMNKIINKNNNKKNNIIYTYNVPSYYNRYKKIKKKHIYTDDEILFNKSLQPIKNNIHELIM